MNQTHTVLDIVQEHIDAFNAGDAERFKATLTRDAVMAFRAVDRVCRGADDITSAFWALRDSFADLHIQVTNAFSNDDHASVEVVRSANSRLDGVRVTVPECFVFKLRQDKIAVISYYTDRMTELVQLGAIAEAQSPPLPSEPSVAVTHMASARQPKMPQRLRGLGRWNRPEINN